MQALSVRVYAEAWRLRALDYAGTFQSVDADGERGVEGDYAYEVAFVDRRLRAEKVNVIERGDRFAFLAPGIGVDSGNRPRRKK